MNTHIWENQQLFSINRELNQFLNDMKVKTIVSFNLVATEDPKGSLSLYSAILIYK
jgi:hypothetical protein